jgi:hypothetical protein
MAKGHLEAQKRAVWAMPELAQMAPKPEDRKGKSLTIMTGSATSLTGKPLTD